MIFACPVTTKFTFTEQKWIRQVAHFCKELRLPSVESWRCLYPPSSLLKRVGRTRARSRHGCPKIGSKGAQAREQSLKAPLPTPIR